MSRSPFSGMSLSDESAPLAQGSDQRLFMPPLETTQQRSNEPTFARDHELPNARSDVPSQEPINEATNKVSKHRNNEKTKPRALGSSSQRRVVERHSHDIYHDQVQWLNRTKLDIEERYDVKATGNAIVRLALDLVRDDYVRNGDSSRLVRILIDGGTESRLASSGEERES